MKERLDICSKPQWTAIQKPFPIPFALLHTTSESGIILSIILGVGATSDPVLASEI